MKFIFCALPLMAFSQMVYAKTVHYELTVTKQSINLSGKKTVDWALMVNQSIPAPTLEFTEGDDAEILVKNGLANEETSVHWHGILLPPSEDGVSYITTPPIHAGQSRLFKFKIRQHGTYWYHSHTMVQEQKGVFGAIVIHPKKEILKVDKDIVAVISDWSDENATQIIRNLRKDGDYYLYKKNSMRSVYGALSQGQLLSFLGNEWTRMGGMDVSDVGYDAFLINGKRESQLAVVHPGQRVRLRIINASASSYFYVSLAGLPMRVISADGIDIDPINAKELLMGMAETYDVLFTVPEHKNFELRATAQDVTGFASGWIGMNQKAFAPNKAYPNLYASMNHGSHIGNHQMDHSQMDHSQMDHSQMDHSQMDHSQMDHSQMDHSQMDHSQMDHSQMDHSQMDHSQMDHSQMDHSAHMSVAQKQDPPAPEVETLTVDDLKAQSVTAFPQNGKTTDLKLVLGGDMERYVWHINGKAISQERNLFVSAGDIVRFTFVNQTMMHHPMHLHGHFFRVLNKNGERSPLKHTVDVPPHGTRTIEFLANEPGQWMLHCHNLYHMKTGMARVVNYLGFQPLPEVAAHQQHDPHMHDHIYYFGQVDAATNRLQGHFKAMRTWDEMELKLESRNSNSNTLHADGSWDFEGDLLYRHWYGNFLNLMAGVSSYNKQEHVLMGVGYILPLLIHSQLFINQEAHIRLDLEKRIQWTKNIFSDVEWNWRPHWESEHARDGDHDSELAFSLMYGPSWNWAAGLTVTNESVGIGAQGRF